MDLITVILANLIALAPLILCPEHEKKNAAAATTPNAKLVRTEPSAGRFLDTIAGQCAKAFIEAFNSNEPDKVRAFEETHRAKSALKTRTTDERVAQAKQLYADWGRLDVLDVIADGETDITVVANATGSGATLDMEFVLEDEKPHGLIAIRIGVAMGAPTGARVDDAPLGLTLIRETIHAIAAELEGNYVYPETGTKLAAALHASLEAGRYDDVDSAAVLASRVTRELQGICHDKHLAIRAARGDNHGESNNSWWASGPRANFGFVKVERLPGNVGYIKFDEFNPSDEAKQVAAAAMNFVANTDALIFDLRENGGGSPVMIAFLSGYLFDKSVHLNSFYYRPTDSHSETWSDVGVPGARFGQDKPVFVLTSSYTFSGAEEFTYNLRNLKRATIVGQTTGGGAHPVQRKALNDRFTIMVPYGRAINPITKTNWEGVGVKPHVKTTASDALKTAQRLALNSLLEKNPDEAQRRQFQSALRALEGVAAVGVRP